MNKSRNYYKYLKNYSPEFLRKYQTGHFGWLGRRSHWDTLVLKMGAESNTNDDYILPHIKWPQWFDKMISIGLWYFIFYCFFVFTFYGNLYHYFILEGD